MERLSTVDATHMCDQCSSKAFLRMDDLFVPCCDPEMEAFCSDDVFAILLLQSKVKVISCRRKKELDTYPVFEFDEKGEHL